MPTDEDLGIQRLADTFVQRLWKPVLGDFLPLYSQLPKGTRPLRRPSPATQGFHDHPRSSECHRLPQKRRLQVAKASYPFPNPLQLSRVLRIGTSKKHTDQLGEHAIILSSAPRAEEPQETYRYQMACVMEIHNGANQHPPNASHRWLEALQNIVVAEH